MKVVSSKFKFVDWFRIYFYHLQLYTVTVTAELMLISDLTEILILKAIVIHCAEEVRAICFSCTA